MSAAFPFQRLFVINPTQQPDIDLLRYATMLASLMDRPELVIATPPGEMAMRYLAPISRCLLGERLNAVLSFRVMIEPDISLLFDEAAEGQCDLIVARHPRKLLHSRQLLKQLLFDAPCSVCIVPEGASPSFRRPLVRIEPCERGGRLLEMAAALSKRAGSEEIVAVHQYFGYGLNSRPEFLEHVYEQRMLELYRFLARVNLAGVNCTPVLEETPRRMSALLRLAARRGADLLIFDPANNGAPAWQWNARVVESIARAAKMPILAVRTSRERSFMTVLQEQVFCEMEPIFN